MIEPIEVPPERFPEGLTLNEDNKFIHLCLQRRNLSRPSRHDTAATVRFAVSLDKRRRSYSGASTAFFPDHRYLIDPEYARQVDIDYVVKSLETIASIVRQYAWRISKEWQEGRQNI